MDIKDLKLLNHIEDINKWLENSYEYRKSIAKALLMPYIQYFAQVEHFILSSIENKNELYEYMRKNIKLDDVKNIKQIYEELFHFIGFSSIEFNFFIDDLINDMTTTTL